MKPHALVVGASLAATLFVHAAPMEGRDGPTQDEQGWISLFNGRDLRGWTPKIRGHELGENFGGTFRVEDGLLRVVYDAYENFDERFGHLFYEHPYSHYRLRLEYRFVGEQVPGGPGWALRNSGVMIHGQDPASMLVNQSFPVSIEVQLLGGDGQRERHTGNLCTPGTHVVMGGQLVRRHCTDSTSPTYHGEGWVKAEIVVHGHRKVEHWIEGVKVLEYQQPQLDMKDGDAARLLGAGAKVALSGGSISLQSESHPIDFRKIELLPLEER